ncbi:phosphatidate cytidylyltransferase [Aggregatilinea lenta]|uniref:phosphatidate cytidylyltransferase n=1 Tax=Aggregatilinea lenta TaxID=913108 RepID=UPI000E5B15F8|nr:phosphatidate cytidylyltransferase [Aggregatilinea lenta]
MLRTRFLVALVALPILGVVTVIGGALFALVVVAALLLGGWEYVQLMRMTGVRVPPSLTYGLIVLAVGTIWFERPALRAPGVALLLMAAAFYMIAAFERGEAQPVTGAALAMFGGFYIGWLGSTLLAVRLLDDGAALTAFLYGAVVVSDTAAYFVGRSLGKHHMSPHVSPKKTWEGYAGSVGGGLLFGLLAAWALHVDGLTAGHGAMIGLLIGVLGTVGDLGESVMKRQVGAKDSSRLIPGHGGLLDRLDSVLVSFAIGYYYLIWFVT